MISLSSAVMLAQWMRQKKISNEIKRACDSIGVNNVKIAAVFPRIVSVRLDRAILMMLYEYKDQIDLALADREECLYITCEERINGGIEYGT